ncbi:MAG TPA: hypothetical protein VGX70_01515 [Gemmataceae bacterium]|nr:hypothetical protein [Gemmataceae bacterium]
MSSTYYLLAPGQFDALLFAELQYSYTLMSGGVNNSRLTGMTYPSGRSIGYNYAGGLDDTNSRVRIHPNSLKD